MQREPELLVTHYRDDSSAWAKGCFLEKRWSFRDKDLCVMPLISGLYLFPQHSLAYYDDYIYF